jgi:hypothetical protein
MFFTEIKSTRNVMSLDTFCYAPRTTKSYRDKHSSKMLDCRWKITRRAALNDFLISFSHPVCPPPRTKQLETPPNTSEAHNGWHERSHEFVILLCLTRTAANLSKALSIEAQNEMKRRERKTCEKTFRCYSCCERETFTL